LHIMLHFILENSVLEHVASFIDSHTKYNSEWPEILFHNRYKKDITSRAVRSIVSIVWIRSGAWKVRRGISTA
jgi:hypothetical protein